MVQNDILIKLNNIHVEANKRTIINDVTMNVHANEIMTIIGPNGAGKTTLVRVILGIQKPTHGNIWRANKLNIGYMPQKIAIEPTMPLTVERFLQFDNKKFTTLNLDIVEQTKINLILKHMMFELSGGEMQRVLLARALMRQPKLLILDEPAQGLDMAGQIEFYNLLAKIQEKYACAIVMISHDLNLVMSKTDTVICLHQHICCHGRPEEVSQNPQFQALFGAIKNQPFAFYTHHHDHKHNISGDIVTGDDKE